LFKVQAYVLSYGAFNEIVEEEANRINKEEGAAAAADLMVQLTNTEVTMLRLNSKLRQQIRYKNMY
jgi:hypothetical protein